MTPVSSLLDPASNSALYTSTVLTLYLDLPDTPLRASTQDQRLAHRLFETGVPISVVEAALLLASLRRLCRPSDVPPLPRVRSLAYFQPVIEELQLLRDCSTVLANEHSDSVAVPARLSTKRGREISFCAESQALIFNESRIAKQDSKQT